MASVNIGNEDTYPTQIPSLQDNADIQSAFLLYHYGQEVEPETYDAINPDSIAGHLKNLNDSKLNVDAVKIVSGIDNDFDTKTETGFYSVGTSLLASATNGIPTVGGVKYPGMLSVAYEPLEGVTYQTYHMTDGTTSGINEKAWRAKYNGAWTAWKFDNSHTHDASAITSGILPLTRGGTGGNTPLSARSSIGAQAANITTTNAVVVTDSSGNIAASDSITTTELGYIDGLTSNAQTQLGQKATTYNASGVTSGVKIFIQSSSPTGASAGDIWFW